MFLIVLGITVALVMTQVLPGSGPPGGTPTDNAATPHCGTETPVVEVFVPEVMWTSTEGSDGVRVHHPYMGWTWTEGSDGRRVVLPMTGWTWTEGSDGRRLIMPLTGWTWTEGEDGRRVIMPQTGWTWTEGADGRRVVHPLTGWTWDESQDGRRVVYPLHRAATYRSTSELLYEALEITPELAPYRELIMSQMGLFDSEWE